MTRGDVLARFFSLGRDYHFYYITLMLILSITCPCCILIGMKKSRPNKPIVNRSARFEYTLGEELVAGLSLTGPEVRAARLGHIQLKGAYVSAKNGQLELHNASFSVINNQKGENSRTVDDRPRKLLAHRKEIDRLEAAKKQGMTIVPTKLLNTGRYIKLVIALAKGKKRWDKRETIKQRDLERESKR